MTTCVTKDAICVIPVQVPESFADPQDLTEQEQEADRWRSIAGLEALAARDQLSAPEFDADAREVLFNWMLKNGHSS